MIGYGFEYFQSMFVVIAVISLAGGITTIIGASLVNSKGPKTAGIVVIIGSVIAGLNLISLIGGILLFLWRTANYQNGDTGKHPGYL